MVNINLVNRPKGPLLSSADNEQGILVENSSDLSRRTRTFSEEKFQEELNIKSRAVHKIHVHKRFCSAMCYSGVMGHIGGYLKPETCASELMGLTEVIKGSSQKVASLTCKPPLSENHTDVILLDGLRECGEMSQIILDTLKPGLLTLEEVVKELNRARTLATQEQIPFGNALFRCSPIFYRILCAAGHPIVLKRMKELRDLGRFYKFRSSYSQDKLFMARDLVSEQLRKAILLKSREASLALQEMQENPDDYVPIRLAEACGASGLPEAVLILQGMQSHSSVCVRQAVVRALVELGSSEEIITTLKSISSDEDKWVKMRALLALVELKELDASEALRLILEDFEPGYLTSIILDATGACDAAAISLLKLMLNDGNRFVCSSIASTLGRIKTTNPDTIASVLSILESMLKHPDSFVRISVVIALDKITADDSAAFAPAVFVLKTLSNHPDFNVRINVAKALGEIKKTDADTICSALSILEGMSNDENPAIRERVAISLGEIKTTDADTISSALSILEGMSNDENPLIRERVAISLGEIKAVNPVTFASAVSLLRSMSGDESLTIRASVATALQNIKPTILQSEPNAMVDVYATLKSLLDDDFLDACESATIALVTIGTPKAIAILESMLYTKRYHYSILKRAFEAACSTLEGVIKVIFRRAVFSSNPMPTVEQMDSRQNSYRYERLVVRKIYSKISEKDSIAALKKLKIRAQLSLPVDKFMRATGFFLFSSMGILLFPAIKSVSKKYYSFLDEYIFRGNNLPLKMISYIAYPYLYQVPFTLIAAIGLPLASIIDHRDRSETRLRSGKFRAAIAEAYGEMKTPCALDALKEVERDDHDFVAQAVAEALCKFGTREAFLELLKLQKESKNVETEKLDVSLFYRKK